MRKFLPILLSGLLATLGFPIACYSPNLIPAWLSATVVWVSYVPIAVSLRDASPRESFCNGYLFGLMAKGGTLFWIIIAMQKYGGLSFLTSASIFLLLILYLALLPAVGFYVIARLRTVTPRWLLATVVFTLAEWTIVYFPLEGFPWTSPAYSLYGASRLIQVADVIGTSGLNAIIFLGNFLLVEAYLFPAFRRRAALAIGIIGVVLTGYGELRLSHVETVSANSVHVRIGLLQGNIPQDLKWSHDERDNILQTYLALTKEADAAGAKLIVWPEASYPWTTPRDTRQLFPPSELQRRADLVVGVPTFHYQKNRRYFQNSAFVIAPDGSIRVRYDKQHLVPFGEYVPLEDVLPMHYIVPAVAGNFSRGDHPQLARTDGREYGILICYEVLFPDLAVALSRKGAHFLVNITNDAWFDETSGPYQHLHFGAFRAIETRRSVVRAANTGVTAWFDPTGRIHSPTSLFTRAAVVADIPTNEEMTFYVQFPQLIPLLALLTFLGCALRGHLRKRKERS